MAGMRQTAVVTGGGSGIARSVALRLGARGFAVAVVDQVAEAAQRVAAEVAEAGGQAEAFAADVSATGQVEAAFRAAQAAFGPAGVLVHVAGYGAFAPFEQMSEAAWTRMLDVHLTGTFRCIKAALPAMTEAGWGRIVTTASVAGMNGGGAGLAHYAAAKSGVIGLTKALALELGPLGITVNAVAPGLIDTPGLRRSGISEEILEHSRRATPARRVGLPEDVAAPIEYIVSEEAGFFTGQVLSPNGGVYM